MAAEEQRRTFISYSRVNKDFALRLATELRSAGFPIWLDQLDIPPGVRWDDALEAALESCELFLVILTPASMASDNVKDEIGYAIDAQKRILPILLENAHLPLRLRRFQYVDFTSKSFDEGVESAKQLLKNLMDEPTRPRITIPPGFHSQKAQEDFAQTKTGTKRQEEGGEADRLMAEAQPSGEKHISKHDLMTQKSEAKNTDSRKRSRLPLMIAAIGAFAVLTLTVIAISIFNRSNLNTRGPDQIQNTPIETSIKESPVAKAPVTETLATEPVMVDTTAQVPVTGNLHIFWDDFSDTASGWDNNEEDYYENGHYYLSVVDDETVHRSAPDLPFSQFGPDIRMEADVNKFLDSNFGMFCRRTADGAYYQLVVESAGSFSIWYFDGENWDELTAGSLSGEPATFYHLQADCIGDTLTLFVNDVQVAEVTDDRLTEVGEFGLFAESTNPAGSKIEYDNFIAYTPFKDSPCSTKSDQSINVDIENQTDIDLVYFWIDFDCNAQYSGSLPIGQRTTLSTYVTSPFLFVDSQTGQVVFRYIAQEGDTSITIP